MTHPDAPPQDREALARIVPPQGRLVMKLFVKHDDLKSALLYLGKPGTAAESYVWIAAEAILHQMNGGVVEFIDPMGAKE